MGGVSFLGGDGGGLQGAPGPDDVGEDEGDEEGDDGHGAHGEETGAAVGEGEGALEVGVGGVVGGIVEACAEEEGEHGEHGTGACEPDAAVAHGEQGSDEPGEHEQHADAEECEDGGHGQQVIEVLAGLREDEPGLRLHGKTRHGEPVPHIGQEEDQEQPGLHGEPAAAVEPQSAVPYVIEEVEAGKGAREEEHREPEADIPRVRHGLQPMPRGCPGRDDRGGGIRDGRLVHRELRTMEEGAHRRADEHRREHAVSKQEPAVGRGPEQVAALELELVGNGLQHKAEQQQHPHPVGTAEAGGVEERESREEGPAEDDERGERELPLAPRGQQEHAALLLCFAELPQEGLSALHEHEENEQGPQQGDEEPPVLLQEEVRHMRD